MAKPTNKLAHVLQKGLWYWINPQNRIPVIQIHYSADPDKDPDTEQGKKWYKEARDGVSDADWEREMEINWHVRAGKRFYQEFTREYVSELQFNPSLPVYRSWDFGYHHPAVLWIQCDTREVKNGFPRVFVLRELMGNDITLERFAKGNVLWVYDNEKDVKFWDYCDAAGRHVNDKSERTSIEIMENLLGLRVRYKKIGIKPGCDIVRQCIAAGQLYVDVTCRHLIDGFMGGYVYPKYRIGMSKEESEVPEIGNYYSHLMDCLRYFFVNFFDVKGRSFEPHQRKIATKPVRPKASFYGPGNSPRKAQLLWTSRTR